MTHDTETRTTVEQFLSSFSGQRDGLMLELRLSVIRNPEGDLVLVPSEGERADGTPVGFRRHQFRLQGDRIVVVPPRAQAA